MNPPIEQGEMIFARMALDEVLKNYGVKRASVSKEQEFDAIIKMIQWRRSSIAFETQN